MTSTKTSMNIRAAFLHNVADTLGSLAVIVAGTLILLYDWRFIDPLVTLLIAGYVLWQSFSEIGPVIRILMLGSPPNMETKCILRRMQTIDGVEDVHHAHFWQMDENRNAVDAHVVISEGCWYQADSIKQAVKAMLLDEFGISHITLELECNRHACQGAQSYGDNGERDTQTI